MSCNCSSVRGTQVSHGEVYMDPLCRHLTLAARVASANVAADGIYGVVGRFSPARRVEYLDWSYAARNLTKVGRVAKEPLSTFMGLRGG